MGEIAICPPTRIVVTWHNVLGLREVTRMVVEIISPFKIIGLLARGGLCLPCDDIFACWCYLGYSRNTFFFKAVEELIYLFIRHYAQHLVKK